MTTVAEHSRGVTAGSMRGYGTLQTMTALEVLVDESGNGPAARPDRIPPSQCAQARRPESMTGNPYVVSVRTPEILDKLEKHPIWRSAPKKRREDRRRESLVGTGVAARPRTMVREGTARWGPSKSRPRVVSPSIAIGVEMGNGIGTALASRVASHLGGMADEVAVRADRYIRCAGSRDLRRCLHDESGDAGRGVTQSAVGAGDQFGHRAPRSALMSALTRQPRRHASSSASVSGPRRSSCGASRRTTRRASNGARRVGRMACS